jgi:hypothetical protein
MAKRPKKDGGLHIVKPGKVLHWPIEVIRHIPVPERHKKRLNGFRLGLLRKGLVRGEEGYVVDLDDPRERILCRGQEGRLMPLQDAEGGRSRPRKASKEEFQPYLDWCVSLGEEPKKLSSLERDPDEMTPAERRALASAQRRAKEAAAAEKPKLKAKQSSGPAKVTGKLQKPKAINVKDEDLSSDSYEEKGGE